MPASAKNYRVVSKDPREMLFKFRLYKSFRESFSTVSLSEKCLYSDDCDDFVTFIKGEYDVIIAGSDEIWKTDGVRGFPNPYWLGGDLHCRKISYAASSRSDLSALSVAKQSILRSLINDFEFIGVRDIYTYKEISKYIDVHSRLHLCCDPTFTYDFNPDSDRGKEILNKKYGIDTSKKCIGLMTRDKNLVKALKSEFSAVNLISLYEFNSTIHNLPNLSPFEWIDVVASIDFLATNFFHGACFALLTNTPFIAIDVRSASYEQSKLYDLLYRENLLDRFAFKKDRSYISSIIDACKQGVNGEKPCFSQAVMNQKALFQPFIVHLKSNDKVQRDD